jgi:hypothetical protein
MPKETMLDRFEEEENGVEKYSKITHSKSRRSTIVRESLRRWVKPD